jgi:hypothetical protein
MTPREEEKDEEPSREEVETARRVLRKSGQDADAHRVAVLLKNFPRMMNRIIGRWKAVIGLVDDQLRIIKELRKRPAGTTILDLSAGKEFGLNELKTNAEGQIKRLRDTLDEDEVDITNVEQQTKFWQQSAEYAEKTIAKGDTDLDIYEKVRSYIKQGPSGPPVSGPPVKVPRFAHLPPVPFEPAPVPTPAPAPEAASQPSQLAESQVMIRPGPMNDARALVQVQIARRNVNQYRVEILSTIASIQSVEAYTTYLLDQSGLSRIHLTTIYPKQKIDRDEKLVKAAAEKEGKSLISNQRLQGVELRTLLQNSQAAVVSYKGLLDALQKEYLKAQARQDEALKLAAAHPSQFSTQNLSQSRVELVSSPQREADSVMQTLPDELGPVDTGSIVRETIPETATVVLPEPATVVMPFPELTADVHDLKYTARPPETPAQKIARKLREAETSRVILVNTLDLVDPATPGLAELRVQNDKALAQIRTWQMRLQEGDLDVNDQAWDEVFNRLEENVAYITARSVPIEQMAAVLEPALERGLTPLPDNLQSPSLQRTDSKTSDRSIFEEEAQPTSSPPRVSPPPPPPRYSPVASPAPAPAPATEPVDLEHKYPIPAGSPPPPPPPEPAPGDNHNEPIDARVIDLARKSLWIIEDYNPKDYLYFISKTGVWRRWRDPAMRTDTSVLVRPVINFDSTKFYYIRRLQTRPGVNRAYIAIKKPHRNAFFGHGYHRQVPISPYDTDSSQNSAQTNSQRTQ